MGVNVAGVVVTVVAITNGHVLEILSLHQLAHCMKGFVDGASQQVHVSLSRAFEGRYIQQHLRRRDQSTMLRVHARAEKKPNVGIQHNAPFGCLKKTSQKYDHNPCFTLQRRQGLGFRV